ncbi:MAG: hypothetical protein P8X73_02555 [Ignavibacteriaceae bacterium]
MPDEIIPGIAANDLLKVQNTSIAIADENQKIVWFNQSFKEDVGGGRIKGNNFITMFSIPENIILSNKKSLLAQNQQNNLGFHLTEILKCESLIISPCFFEEDLLAIILNCANISRSDLGIIIFHGKNDKSEFLFYDPENQINNKDDVEKSIASDFSFINKWLHLNKKSLLAQNQQNNLGFHLTEILKCESLIISPCFFEEDLLAKIFSF